VHNSWDVELPDVGVLLADTDEHDWLACRVNHVDGSADLVIHRVELGQDDPINSSRVVLIDCKVDQRLVELRQLVNRVVSDQGFSDEQDHIWLVDVNKLGQLSHQALVALHSACSVD